MERRFRRCRHLLQWIEKGDGAKPGDEAGGNSKSAAFKTSSHFRNPVRETVMAVSGHTSVEIHKVMIDLIFPFSLPQTS